MKRKIMLSVLAVTVIWVMIWHNLVSNSVYYAKHMPHKEGSEPVLVMIMDNYFWLIEPEGLIYEEDGNFLIRKKFNDTELYFSTADFENAKSYSFYDGNITYKFDKTFQLIFAYDSDTFFKNGLDLTIIDQKKVISEIYELVQPIIDAQKPPIINLQWLFNLLNYSRFN